MTRLNFIVEGRTEEAFVRECLTPHLSALGVYASARSVETSRHGARIYRGGLINYGKAKADIMRWISQDQTAFVTTMFDFYALPESFPGFVDSQAIENPYQKIEAIEDAFASDIGSERFIPYIQLHEFEALLFSDPKIIDNWMELFKESGKTLALESIINKFETPEHINQGRSTAPSKRLKNLYKAYDKVFIGSGAGKQIGIPKMKGACLHFSNWLDKLTNLGQNS